MATYVWLALVAFCVATSAAVDVGPSYLADETYTGIYPAYPCVTLVGADGPIGCATSRDGVYGFLKLLKTQEDIDKFASSNSNPLILVVSSALFTKSNYEKLVKDEHVKGLLVLRSLGGRMPESFSPSSYSPNREFGLYKNSKLAWNPMGDSFANQKFSIPMFALDEVTSEQILAACFENDENGAQWGAKLQAWMHPQPSTDPATCLRRRTCAPLGGKSVIAALETIVPERPILLASATTDASAFFHDLAFGASAYQSGTVALMAAAEALARVGAGAGQLEKQILFAFFTGEAWGYLGSKRFVTDIAQGFECEEVSGEHCSSPFRSSLVAKNISIDAITDMVDVSQLGNPERDDESGMRTFYLHSDPSISSADDLVADFEFAASGVPRISVSSDTPWEELPPSPLQTFLAANPSIRGLVLADHSAEFRTSYYGSRFDTADHVDLDGVCRASSVIARALYKRAAPEGTTVPPSLSADCDIVNSLYACFENSIVCNTTQMFYNFTNGEIPPPTHYVGVYSERRVDLNTKFMFDWLSNATADHVGDRCEGSCVGGSCLAGHCVVNTHTFYYDAISPGFERRDGVFEVVDSSEPLWTESYWHGPNMKIFRMVSPTEDWVVLVGGVAFFTVTTVLVLAVQRFSSHLF